MDTNLQIVNQNAIQVQSYSQSNVMVALGSMLDSQNILLNELYYGTVGQELDTSQPYADISQVQIVPNGSGGTNYVFLDHNGSPIKTMRQASTNDPAIGGSDFDASGNINTALNLDLYDINSGEVTRAGVQGTDAWYGQRGQLIIKPTEGAALADKTQELDTASNAIQMLGNLLGAQQSAVSAWINAIR